MKRFKRLGQRAVAALEFAIVLPPLVMLLLAGGDMSVWMLDKFRLDSTAATVGNLVAAANTLPASAFPPSYCSVNAATLNYFAVASQVADPLPVCGGNGATIISGISNTGSATTIVWQERTGSAAAYPSRFGAAGAAPTLPVGYAVPSGHNIIVTEVYTSVSAWNFSRAFMSGPGPGTLYAYSIFEPRLGTLPTPH